MFDFVMAMLISQTSCPSEVRTPACNSIYSSGPSCGPSSNTEVRLQEPLRLDIRNVSGGEQTRSYIKARIHDRIYQIPVINDIVPYVTYLGPNNLVLNYNTPVIRSRLNSDIINYTPEKTPEKMPEAKKVPLIKAPEALEGPEGAEAETTPYNPIRPTPLQFPVSPTSPALPPALGEPVMQKPSQGLPPKNEIIPTYRL